MKSLAERLRAPEAITVKVTTAYLDEETNKPRVELFKMAIPTLHRWNEVLFEIPPFDDKAWRVVDAETKTEKVLTDDAGYKSAKNRHGLLQSCARVVDALERAGETFEDAAGKTTLAKAEWFLDTAGADMTTGLFNWLAEAVNGAKVKIAHRADTF